MRQFLLIAVLIGFAIFASCQKWEGMEYAITDSATLFQYKSKIPLLTNEGKAAELAQTYKRIGDYFYVLGRQDSLLYYYKNALKQYEIVKDSFHISYCYFRVGEESSYAGNYDVSISWHLPAAKFFERMGESHMAAFSNYALSTVYKAKGELNLYRQYLNKAIEYNKQAKDTLLEIIILGSYFGNLQKEKKWSELYKDSEKMLQLSRMIKQPVFIKIGLLYMGVALMEQGFPAKALPFLEASSRMMVHTLSAHEDAFWYLIICHARLHHTKETEKYTALYKQVTDSLRKKQETDHYKELLVQYETEKKEATIAALERENKLKEKLGNNQRNLIILLASGLGLLVLSSWFVYKNFRRRQKLEDQLHKQQEQFSAQLQNEKEQKMLAEFNKQLAEVQLTALSAQMNPHFIFNCMNSVQKYILKNEREKAMDFLQNFSDLMRAVLDNSAKIKVGLDEEINMLEKYILLEQQRLENRFDYRIELGPDLQTDFFEIPAMIIQPYVENAIWHGLMNLPDDSIKGLLQLKFEKKNSYIKCTVADNGVGRQQAAKLELFKSPKRKSYGMAITQKRLELLQNENEIPPEIIIDDLFDSRHDPAGTKVTLFIHID